MAFRDVLKKQRQSGAGILPAVGTAAGASIREAVDIRNLLFSKGSLLGALFPNIKGFKADSITTKTRTSPTSLLSMGAGSPALSDVKLDIISQNTKISAKNSMILPSMARDMNVMRQNIVKLVKLSGGKASTRADMFFMKAAERERAYESQMQESKAPSPVAVKETETGGGEKSGMLGTLLKTLGGILAIVGVGMVAYFNSPEFKKLVDERVIKPLSDNFDSFKEKLIEVGKDFLMVAAGVVAAYVGLKAVAAAAAGKLALLALANPVVLAGAIGAAVGAWLISRDRKKADTVMNIQDRKATGEAVSEEEEKVVQEWHRKHNERDRRQFESLNDLTNPQEGPSTAALAIKRFLRFGVGKGDEALRNPQAAIETPAPTPVPPAPEPPSTAPTPAANSQSSGLDVESIMEQVRRVEGGRMGYDAANRGRAGDTPGGMPGLSGMTIAQVRQLQNERKLFAAGAYQIIPNTMNMILENGVVKESDIFNKETQDKMGRWLIERRINLANRRGEDPQLQLSQEFASIANPETGRSFYEGKGGNKALISSIYGPDNNKGTFLASASTSAEQFRMESMDALSMIPSMLGLMMPKTPSTPAQQVSIPSTIDSDLFDALVMRVTEYS